MFELLTPDRVSTILRLVLVMAILIQILLAMWTLSVLSEAKYLHISARLLFKEDFPNGRQ